MGFIHRLGVSVASLAVVGLACSGAQGAGQAPAAVPAQAASDHVVAEVSGRTITLKELDAKWQEMDPAEQARVTQLLYQNRRNVLDQMVGDALIEEAAKAAGQSAGQFLDQEIAKRSAAPTEAEIRQFFEANKDRAEGRPFEELRSTIEEYLAGQRKMQARAQLVEDLKKKASRPVRVMLDPPRSELAVASHDPVRGPAGAPITIIEFSDYQCPFCQRVNPTLEKLLAAYPGKIRLAFKDFPLPNHPQAPKASEAAHCANEQGKYWEMHDRIFANQRMMEVPVLKKHAAELGLDTARFDQCVDSGKYADVIQEDLEEGQKLGVQSTPTLYVNGRPVVGAQPYEYFVSVIEEELARAR